MRRVAVLIPCFNEEATVAEVVAGFRAAVPAAAIYVYDNNSTDGTVARAREAGAIVRAETRQGKGAVVRRMFADVEADAYVLVDGDATYDAPSLPSMLERLFEERLDMVVAARASVEDLVWRRGHVFGNRLLTGLVSFLFSCRIADMLSGYRVLSRRYVKSFPIFGGGFEIEPELTVHALSLAMPTAELFAPYRERPPGSVSKLRTYTDGMRILRVIIVLLKEERPLLLFSAAFCVLLAFGIGLGTPVVVTFLETGLVPRLPTAVLATGLVLLAFLSLACGLILDSVARGRVELRRLAYLAIAAPSTEE